MGKPKEARPIGSKGKPKSTFKPRKTAKALISTMGPRLELTMDYKATGQELLDKVLATLDVRESWYFDIMYDNTKDMNTFVNRSHKVFVGSHKPGARPNRFRLVIKFYPEDVVELVQPETRHLFFLQLLYCVTAGELACPSEAAVLLASYAIQAKYGNYDSQAHVPGFLSSEVILPSRITGQANSTPRLWEEKIIQYYMRHVDLLPEEAEMEFLRIVQDLEMYGVNYFKIRMSGKVNKDSMMWLGVDAFGLNIYDSQDKLAPESVLPWCDIKNVYYSDKKFTVDTIKNTEPFLVDFVFYSSTPATNKIILALCVGNHALYIKRRREGGFPELEHLKQELETERREAAQKGLLFRDHGHAILNEQLKQFKTKAEDAEVALIENAETTQLLVETVEIAETEAALLWQKAEQTETQLNEMMRQNENAQREKRELQYQLMQAEEYARQLAADTDRIRMENTHLTSQLEVALSETQSALAMQDVDTRSVYSQGGLSTHGIPPPSDDTQRLLKSLQAEQAVFNSKSMLVEAQLRQLQMKLPSQAVADHHDRRFRAHAPMQPSVAHESRAPTHHHGQYASSEAKSADFSVAFFEEL